MKLKTLPNLIGDILDGMVSAVDAIQDEAANSRYEGPRQDSSATLRHLATTPYDMTVYANIHAQSQTLRDGVRLVRAYGNAIQIGEAERLAHFIYG